MNLVSVPTLRRLAAFGGLTALSLMSAFPEAALAQATPGAPGGSLPLVIGQGPGGTSYSVPIQTLLFFTALSFIPAVLLLMTSFTRIVIVLSLLRQALGTQSAPPNQVIIGLSLFLTMFVMGPTIDRVYTEAYQPYSNQQIDFDVALQRAEVPVREFMLKQTRESDFALFAKLAKLDPSVTAQDAPFRVIVPAFVTSELKSAFQIGFMIFIPFLIIDMIVASVLMSLGMMMLSPVLVALPFKLMLFVLADGWNLLLGSLAASFVTWTTRDLHGRHPRLHHRPAGALHPADAGRTAAAHGPGHRPGRQHLPGRHPDPRGHLVLRAQAGGRSDRARHRRALDDEHPGGVHPAHHHRHPGHGAVSPASGESCSLSPMPS